MSTPRQVAEKIADQVFGPAKKEPDNLTPERLAELRAMLSDVRPGEWIAGLGTPLVANNDPDPTKLWIDSLFIGQFNWLSFDERRKLAALAVAAYNALPALLSAAERLAVVEAEREHWDAVTDGLAKQCNELRAERDDARQRLPLNDAECQTLSELLAERDALRLELAAAKHAISEYLDVHEQNHKLREQLAAANEAATYMLTVLMGACDNGEERWSRKQLNNLVQHIRGRWPQFDPSSAALAAKGATNG